MYHQGYYWPSNDSLKSCERRHTLKQQNIKLYLLFATCFLLLYWIISRCSEYVIDVRGIKKANIVFGTLPQANCTLWSDFRRLLGSLVVGRRPVDSAQSFQAIAFHSHHTVYNGSERSQAPRLVQRSKLRRSAWLRRSTCWILFQDLVCK